ncbi:MAG: ubiquinol-cytochrome-c reductase complex assembly factor 3 [Gemmataceae bacterium]|nr:ubiquinol-cytochrome-c reductase complex assembly factor 3 [Gemmataceae bacterium]
MVPRHLVGAMLALGLGLGCPLFVASALPQGADKERIDKLVSQLGSQVFTERMAATQELDAIGAPALEALKKAATSNEPEQRRRAEELVARIERRVEAQRLLAPTRVRLVCKDTPVADAVADLAKKSGVNVILTTPAQAKERRVTLDTGEASFWQALDLLCHQGGLIEVGSVDVPLRVGDIQPPQAAAGIGQVLLADGKPLDLPTQHAGAARIRALPPNTPVLASPRGQGEILFALGARLEPRVQFQSMKGAQIDKALDDQGQDLMPIAASDPAAPVDQPVFIGNVGGMARGIVGTGDHQAPVRLKVGSKPSKTIKELTGKISAEVRTAPEPVMVVDDVFKAVGKTVKGKQGGTLTLAAMERQDDGLFMVRVELQPPPDAADQPILRARIRRGALLIQPIMPQGMQIQVQQAGGGFGFVGDSMGITLLNAKGQTMQLVQTPSRTFKLANMVATHELTLVFKPQEGQGDPARLVYSTARIVTLEVPFTLRDVPLP